MPENVIVHQSRWSIGLSVLIAICVLGPVACTVHEDWQVSELVTKGADPIGASCAIHGWTSMDRKMICAVAAARSTQAAPR